MARRSKNRQDVNNRVNRNPLTRPQPRVPRPRVNFDGMHLNAKRTTQALTVTVLSPSVSQILYADCSSNSSATRECIAANTTIPSNYSEHIYHSIVAEWFPLIGPSHFLAGTQIIGAYLDNPEQIVVADSESINAHQNRIRSTKNMVFCNAWERKSFNLPLTRRLTTFNVNTSASYADIDVVTRSVQGIFLTAASNSVNPLANVSLGYWVVTYKLELRNLTAGLT